MSWRRETEFFLEHSPILRPLFREFRIDQRGIAVGEPLNKFQGVLRGVPTYVGQEAPLMDTA